MTGADTWWSDIEGLVEEAGRLIRDQAWAVTPADRTVAAKAAAHLHAAVGTPHPQQALPGGADWNSSKGAIRRLQADLTPIAAA
ncbi:hypothetical protein [Streptomyces virginiae]|uniref:hypothetical protein n=1 Tax=Streptomyces virginiae TaxID=1961 RepID=UPI003416D956